MIFTKRVLTRSEINRLKSILKKSGRYNLDVNEIEAVSNDKCAITFALLHQFRGREPYNDYFLILKKKFYFVTAETYWDVEEHNNTFFLSAWFHNNNNSFGYDRLVDESIRKATPELPDIVNKALNSLSEGKEQFYFGDIS